MTRREAARAEGVPENGGQGGNAAPLRDQQVAQANRLGASSDFVEQSGPLANRGSTLSNALADLAERVKTAVAAKARAELTAAEQALSAGAMLLEARAQTTHGAWGAFLRRAGVSERQAQRLMRLARSGLKPDTVSGLGGVKATLTWMRGLALPGPGQALVAMTSEAVPGFPVGAVVLADDGDHFAVGRYEADGTWTDCRRPCTPNGAIPVLLFLMRDCLPAVSFVRLEDHDGTFADMVKGRGLFAEFADAARPSDAP